MGNFDEATIQKVWEKGKIKSGLNPATHRLDAYEALIEWDKYGDREHRYGWEIDHIKPISDGGNNDIDNLQPLQWENNVRKSDGKL
jgi:5-methylcytosine-specific restriction endonuclease McrA